MSEGGRGREENGRWKREKRRRKKDAKGEGGREREEGGRRREGQKGGSKATCDQCALQFDSKSHDTGPNLLNYDWSIIGAFAHDQDSVTHCIWRLSISLYLLLASWS